jgi:glycosyltransferase involved in cell wall biosynthesis
VTNHGIKPKHKALLVGGPDVDARLDLIESLSGDFDVVTVGSERSLGDVFARRRLAFRSYRLSRGVSPFGDGAALLQLYRLFLKERPHLVHAFDTKPCVFARLAAKMARVPVVIGTVPGLGALYTDGEHRMRAVRGIYEQLQRAASRLSDATVFQNTDDAAEFERRGIVPASRIRVIAGSGVQTGRYTPANPGDRERDATRREIGVPAGAVLVTMVSRLIRSKGVMLFGEVALRLSSLGASFVLVGAEDEESRHRLTPAEVADLRRHVTWLGPRGDVPRLLAASDVFVLPTYYREGLPRVLIEAAAAGLPIVTTGMAGCRDVVEDGVNGIVVPPRDVEALEAAVSRLIGDATLRGRFGAASRRIALNRFDLSLVVAATRQLYFDLLEQKGA